MTEFDLDKLKSRLEKAVNASQPKKSNMASVIKGYNDGTSLAYRIILEFVLPIGIGVAVGIVLDKEFATAPLFLIIFILLGVGSGFMNMYRIASRDSATNTTPEDS